LVLSNFSPAVFPPGATCVMVNAAERWHYSLTHFGYLAFRVVQCVGQAKLNL
jgi:hypothetical protein